MPMQKVSYDKKPKSFKDQVLLLEKRKLIIANKRKAEKVLSSISYNRLSRYWFPFLKEPKDDEIFKDGIEFDTIFRIYQFDSKLRTLIFNAIEQIEIAIRTQVIYHLSHKYESGFWYENKDAFTSFSSYLKFLKKINDATNDTNEAYIKKYRGKYLQPLPPSWKAFEIITFRTLFEIYKHLNSKECKQSVADHFDLPQHVFESWVDFIVYIRNICAHHARLWNRVMTIKPIWLKSKNRGPWVDNWSDDDPQKIKHKTYVALCTIIFMMNKINPYNTFKKDVLDLIKDYPQIKTMDMGFPRGWGKQDLWK